MAWQSLGMRLFMLLPFDTSSNETPERPSVNLASISPSALLPKVILATLVLLPSSAGSMVSIVPSDALLAFPSSVGERTGC